MNKIVLGAVIVLGIVLVFMLSYVYKKNRLNNQSISQNILYITQPVTSFSGIVDKIEGNRLFVSQKQTLTQNIMPPVAVTLTPLSPYPTPKVVTITYQVIVTDKTQMSQPAPYINYLFKTVTPPPAPKLAIKDIKVGQYITLNSQVDLRTLTGNLFEATMINLPQKMNTLNGKVIQLDGNTIILKAYTPVNKKFTIAITQDTEISRMSYNAAMTPGGGAPPPSKSEKLAVSDLKKDMQMTVYTVEDVTENQNLTALRIEPMSSPATAPAQAPPETATTSAQPTPSKAP